MKPYIKIKGVGAVLAFFGLSLMGLVCFVSKIIGLLFK
jgi:hypothetical protein